MNDYLKGTTAAPEQSIDIWETLGKLDFGLFVKELVKQNLFFTLLKDESITYQNAKNDKEYVIAHIRAELVHHEWVINKLPKKDRNYEHFCNRFRRDWARLKELLRDGDKAISDWDLEIHYYNEPDEDETMCDHYYYGLPAWKQLYSARASCPLCRNHVIADLRRLHFARAYFQNELKQTTLF